MTSSMTATKATTARASDCDPELAALSDSEQIAAERIKLLAAQYVAGSKNREIAARLSILNARLLEKSPPVSEGQVVLLEQASNQLSTLQASREARAKRLGLPRRRS